MHPLLFSLSALDHAWLMPRGVHRPPPSGPPRPGFFPGLDYPLSVTVVSCGVALLAAAAAALCVCHVRKRLREHADTFAHEVDDMAALESPKSPVRVAAPPPPPAI
jgi:hypothetical protein